MANGLVKDLDFFDQKVYSEDVERLEPDDEEDVDPNDFEKKKDTLHQNILPYFRASKRLNLRMHFERSLWKSILIKKIF